MAELVISMISAMILLSGLSSAIFVASSAASPSMSVNLATSAGFALDDIATELRSAKAIISRSTNSITFVVDDRSTDSGTVDEKITYSWDGEPGGLLTRTYNNVSATVLTDVYNFSLQYSSRPVTINRRLVFLQGNVTGTAATYDNTRAQTIQAFGYTVTRKTITSTTPQSEIEFACAGADVLYISPTVVAADLGTKLLSHPKGIVIDSLGTAVYFSLADAGPTDYSETRIKIHDTNHYVSTGLGSFASIYSSTVSIPSLNAKFAAGLNTYGKRPTGSPVTLAIINRGGSLLNNGRAAGPRVLVPFGGSGTDPSQLSATGQLLLQRAIDWAAGVEELTAIDVSLRVVSSTGPVLQTRAEMFGRPRA